MTQTIRIIDSFVNDGKQDSFDQPYGVCVSENGALYVADSMHKRIVVLTPEGEFIKIIENPQSEILEEGFDFIPIKVTVDYADRVYVISRNAFEGILLFESDGSFTGYYGTIEVKITLWEKFEKDCNEGRAFQTAALYSNRIYRHGCGSGRIHLCNQH